MTADDVYAAYADACDEERGIDEIYIGVDALLREGAFDQVDRLLVLAAGGMKISSVTELLAFASMTYAAKDKLQQREAFMAALYSHTYDLIRAFE